MGLIVYKAREFAETYENILFEELYMELGPLFESRSDDAYLIGNYNCQEKQIDAFMIKSNAIIIIEFKNYGGKISFDNDNIEAGIWRSQEVDVKCGQSYINPYRQVANYKTILGDTLKRIQNINTVDPYQSHGIVLFNKNIEDIKTYPDYRFYIWDNNDVSYNTWFHILDKSKIVNKIKHISSRDVWFDDKTLAEFIAKLKEHSMMYLVTEFKRSDTTIGEYFKTRNFPKEQWLVSDSQMGIKTESLLADLDVNVEELTNNYLLSTKTCVTEIFSSLNTFTIADESEIKDFSEKIYYKERTQSEEFLSEIDKFLDIEFSKKMLPEEKVSKVKSDFLSAYYKKIEKVLDEYKRKLFRELSPLFDSNTRSLAIEIGEKIFDIKSYFFKSYAKVNELETEFKQKNNLLMLEIELRSYLFFKYKESLEGIRKLLSTKPFSLVSFIPLFLQISPTSENYLSPQDYMVFALIMNKNLENEPFKETSDYINHELKFDTNYISSALERMKENKLIFNLDKNGTNRLYINAPKIIRLKEEYYPADVL